MAIETVPPTSMELAARARDILAGLFDAGKFDHISCKETLDALWKAEQLLNAAIGLGAT